MKAYDMKTLVCLPGHSENGRSSEIGRQSVGRQSNERRSFFAGRLSIGRRSQRQTQGSADTSRTAGSEVTKVQRRAERIDWIVSQITDVTLAEVRHVSSCGRASNPQMPPH